MIFKGCGSENMCSHTQTCHAACLLLTYLDGLPILLIAKVLQYIERTPFTLSNSRIHYFDRALVEKKKEKGYLSKLDCFFPSSRILAGSVNLLCIQYPSLTINRISHSLLLGMVVLFKV